MTEYTELADRIVGQPEHWGPMAQGIFAEQRAELIEIGTKLDEIMQRCAQAMYDDASCFFASSHGNEDCNASEAAGALDEIADIVGMEGPTSRLDRLYDQIGADEEARSLEAGG